jgi:hypothetical protein
VKTTQKQRDKMREEARRALDAYNPSEGARVARDLLDDLDELRECLRLTKAAADLVRVTPWTVDDEHRIAAALSEPKEPT